MFDRMNNLIEIEFYVLSKLKNRRKNKNKIIYKKIVLIIDFL